MAQHKLNPIKENLKEPGDALKAYLEAIKNAGVATKKRRKFGEMFFKYQREQLRRIIDDMNLDEKDITLATRNTNSEWDGTGGKPLGKI